MPKIHPTAIIEAGAQIAKNVEIGPYSTIGKHVKIAAGTKLLSHVVVAGHTVIGENNTIFPFASLGQPPQDLKYDGENSKLVIGNNNQIREYVTMHLGTADDRSETTVGDNNLFMALSHVAHDCIIGNNCVLANGATLAGHVTLENEARIGGLTAIAQFVRIGRQAFIGGHCGVERDVPPFAKTTRNQEDMAVNIVGLRRSGIENPEIRALSQLFEELFINERQRPLIEIVTELIETPDLTDTQQELLTFILAGKRQREEQ